jgi:DNA repair protein RecN (Recombination protein N)
VLTALAIRDVVLIERLDLGFGPGLTVLTGETGAGKSILLDSLGLALGARAEAGLVRGGAAQASVTACFAPPAGHPVAVLLGEGGIAAEPGEDIVLRRVVGGDGRSRAFVNDQPVGVALLRRIGAALVEVQGQHEQMGLADPASHAALLDAFGVAPPLRAEVAAAWAAWRGARDALGRAREAIAAARRDEEWLTHAVSELAGLAPQPGEEEALAGERQRLQQAERRAEAIAAAAAELSPGSHGRDRRNPGPGAALRSAARALQRLIPTTPRGEVAREVAREAARAAVREAAPALGNPVDPALAALERAEEALAEAETLLSRLAAEAESDPRRLEQAEERLFALRAAARKHAVAVADLPGLLDTLSARLAALQTGEAEVTALETAAAAARTRYEAAAAALSAARAAAARKLDRAVGRELPPLRLEKARFHVEATPLAEADWGPGGADAVRFLIATNPGQELGSLARVASGGELSRLMLALKVVLASGSPVPTLVFDEVDAGIGGATAASVGERLARVAEGVQVLVVTHSPQVAARGAAHFRVAKASAAGRTATLVEALDPSARREEIARMLAGETVTQAARAAAAELLGAR